MLESRIPVPRQAGRSLSTTRFSIAAIILALGAVVPAIAQNPIPPSGAAQIEALLQEKGKWTAAQQKLDSQIIYHAKAALSQPIAGGLAPAHRPGLLEISGGLVHVDIQANVNQGLLAAIAALGGRVESSFAQYNAVRAWLPLLSAETLARRTDVRFVRPAEQAVTHSGAVSGRPVGRNLREANVRTQLARAMPAFATAKAVLASGISAMGPDTSGVKAHGADIVQAMGITGTGIKIGVLSDGVTSLVTEQAAGRLPATVTVLPGQGNQGTGPCPGANCPDEGTAMLEIVYSMAPGAQLYFATAFVGGQAGFAANIQALRAAGCDIIVDDVTYFAEPVFQDGTVAQAVNSVTASGAMYFSAAQNSGNLDSHQSGTWEGDFVDGGTITLPEAGHIHSFGAATFDTITQPGIGIYSLQWSDPFGASCNDYDLFILDSTGANVLASSTSVQSCTQNPIELIGGYFPAGSRIVVVKFGTFTPAQTRALHIDTERGRLSIGTAGATFGHNAAASALTVAATSVLNAGGGIFLGSVQDPPESFSSDGPRQIFYLPNGNAITPGSFTFASGGGTMLAKVDFMAADGVPTGVGDFNPFYGTSAAAPHAAAIAALIKSSNSLLTNGQIISAMRSTALPVTAPAGVGVRTFGAGLIMANLAANFVMPDLSITKSHVGNFTQGQTGAIYTITVTNTGGGPSSGTVTVVDKLATSFTPTALGGTGWSCVLATLTCTRSDSLAPGANYPAITLTVNVGLNAPPSVTNSATVTNPNIAADTDDTANDPTTILPLPPPDLSITKSHAGNFTRGQTGDFYRITITNSGGSPTSGTTTVVDMLPVGLTPTAISGMGWGCVLTTLTCTRTDALAPGASYPVITVTVDIASDAPASVINSAKVTNPNIPPDADDTANDPTDILPPTDLLFFLWFFSA